MRNRVFTALAAAVAFGGLAVVPSAAQAAESCPKGYICFYYGYNQSEGMSFKTNQNWSGSVSARSYFNNAYAQEGYDHVNLTVAFVGTQCVHFGDPDGKGNIPAPPASIRTVTKVTWRGEC
ncbi:peptidase inhibitor family I36 protein [Nonomuraea sp. NPDC003214]